MADPVEATLRFLHYAALLSLFGWTAFPLVGLRGVDRSSDDWVSRALVATAIAAPLLTCALMLVSIAAMMGTPVSTLDLAMVEAMILGTGIGWAFVVRLALLVAAAGALLARRRSAAARSLAAACYAAALVTLAWSGHAAATQGALGLAHRLSDGGHLIAAGMWLGAIGWFARLTFLTQRRPDQVPARPLLSAMHRFAPLGVALVATVTLTGLINSQFIFGLQHSGAVLATGYGQLLAAKLALVGGMLALAAHNARVGRRQALASDDVRLGSSATVSALRRSLAGELALAFGVIALVAGLGLLSPMVME